MEKSIQFDIPGIVYGFQLRVAPQDYYFSVKI